MLQMFINWVIPFTIFLSFGYVISITGIKIRYITSGCFIFFFILEFILSSIFFPNDWAEAIFFKGLKFTPNELALDLLIFVSGISSFITFMVFLAVYSIRKHVFF